MFFEMAVELRCRYHTYILICFPGFVVKKSLKALRQNFLKGPKTDTSNCCRRWDVCGGKESNTTPVSAQ